MMYSILRFFAKIFLLFRYRIKVKGLEDIRKGGTKGILFLPNHPALIDPVIVTSVLSGDFQPRALIHEKQVQTTVLKHLQKPLRFLSLPNMGISGHTSKEKVEEQLRNCVTALQNGDNILLYPAGRIYRSKKEKLRASGAVQRIIQAYPDVRIVLVRTRGLWGSDFSRAKGYQISFGEGIRRHAWQVIANLFFFMPKREVSIELVEKPEDFPENEGKEAINRYLEDFYNQNAMPNTYVPYGWWESGGTRAIAEPDSYTITEDATQVPQEIRDKVEAKLRELTGRESFRDEDTLGTDLGLDSLIVAELHYWLQKEFNCQMDSPENLRTVSSLMLAAIGESSGTEPLKPIPNNWFIPEDKTVASVCQCDKITDGFLYHASRHPDKPLFADQLKGVLTYRQLILAVLALKDSIAKLPGDNIGIIMPATSISPVIFLATSFAGKIPVLLNWTVGPRNLKHCLEATDTQRILTSRVVIERLKGNGTDFGNIDDRFVFLEDLAASISLGHKLASKIRSLFCWHQLRKAKVQETAAIIFTSGSESMPKAVPLTHRNVIEDFRSALKHIVLYNDDCVLGILPPFHSFGLLMNIVLPCTSSLRVMFHANPMEGAMLARLVFAYKPTMAVATPTFVANILRHATSDQVASLRIFITGAEKCPETTRQLIKEKCHDPIYVEGYGISECGPIVALEKQAAPHPGTVGQVIDSLEWAITDEDCTRRLPQGETGMLLVRGVNVFGGYLNYDGPSPFVTFEGKEWYRTGDLVSAEPDEAITFRGRLKRFVKIGGEMVSLPAIEEVLLKNFGQRLPTDKRTGPVLAVEATGDDQHTEITLFTTIGLSRETANQALAEAGFAPICFLRKVVELPEIPVLGTGKTDYRTIKTMG